MACHRMADVDIVGREPGHIEEINHLNHYVGMKPVEPEAIPELRVIPWIVAFLSLFGLVTAALGRRDLLYVWVATVLVAGLAGLADFWWWEYRYGHDLDEQEAIFRVPGMSFQPPLLGKKKILNFTVWSWPGVGGGAAMGAGVLAMVAAARELLRSRLDPPRATARATRERAMKTGDPFWPPAHEPTTARGLLRHYLSDLRRRPVSPRAGPRTDRPAPRAARGSTWPGWPRP